MADTNTTRALAQAAKSIAAAPDYDEEAIRDALWAVVDSALASAPDAAAPEPLCGPNCEACKEAYGGAAPDAARQAERGVVTQRLRLILAHRDHEPTNHCLAEIMLHARVALAAAAGDTSEEPKT